MGKYESIFRDDSFLLDGASFYIKILELVYSVTIPHIFVGSFLSCVIWYFSAKILIKASFILGITKINQSKMLLIYSFLPTSIIFCSVTLREPFQLFFVNYLAFLFLKIIFLKKNIVKNFVLVLLNCYLLSSLHYSFLFSSTIMVSFLIFLYFYDRFKSRISIFILIIISVIIFINIFNSVFSMMYEYEITEAIYNFNQGSSGRDTRAIYRRVSDLTSSIDLFLFFPYAFFQYMSEPLPTRISSSLDLILFFENSFKMLLLLKGVYSLKKHYFFKPQLVVIIYFLIVELVWSVGTTNWGTAARHHIPAFGTLCLLAFMLPNTFYKKRIN